MTFDDAAFRMVVAAGAADVAKVVAGFALCALVVVALVALGWVMDRGE